MSLRAEKPRSVSESPWKPPSPAAMLMPATLRRASRRVDVACSSMTSAGTTLIVWGVSRIGSVNLGEIGTGACAVTSTASVASSVRSAVSADVNR